MSRRTQPPAPAEDNVVERGLIMALVWLASRMPASVAAHALGAGMSRVDAKQVYELAASAAQEQVVELLVTMGIPCPAVAGGDWTQWSHPGFDPTAAADQSAAAGAVTV